LRHCSAVPNQCADENRHTMVYAETRKSVLIQRSLAMALMTVINIIGTAVGFVVPPLFVDGTKPVP
jgi:hypothetical protein